MHVHLVFVCKYRRKLLTPTHIVRLTEICRRVISDFGGNLKELNGGVDHVHLLIDYPAKHAVATVVNSLKGVSSRMLRKEFPSLKRIVKQALWSPSYFCASCGGVTLETIKKYIEEQGGLISQS